MKKLPIFLFTFIFFALLFLRLPFLNSKSLSVNLPINHVYADEPDPGTWVPDAEVTFVGKSVVRANSFLDWTLTNYKWSNNDTPLLQFWANIRNIVYIFLILFILIAGFIIVVTRGKSITGYQFIRQFVIAVILITFSFALIRIMYQVTDIIQGFFIKNSSGAIISAKDLINISYDYTVSGNRLYGPDYDESVFITVLLTRLTSITYNVMATILLLRKVILWFFIAVSPIFPILVLYMPLKNTAKVWISELFRWLFYGPLFAIMLSGLISIWKSNLCILNFDFCGNKVGDTIYPTAVNIFLAGPGKAASLTNSLNYNDTYIQYIVALLMLWAVIFLPFLLLRIFLDYMSAISFSGNDAVGYITNTLGKVPGMDLIIGNKGAASSFSNATYQQINQQKSSRETVKENQQSKTVVNSQTPLSSQSPSMISRQGFGSGSSSSSIAPIAPIAPFLRPLTSFSKPSASSRKSVVASMSSIPTPTIHDVTRFDNNNYTPTPSVHTEITKIHETLQKISTPSASASPNERSQFMAIRNKLENASKRGDKSASSVMAASSMLSVIKRSANQPQVKKEEGKTEENKDKEIKTDEKKAPEAEDKNLPESEIILNDSNDVQTVEAKDFEKVRDEWEKYYEAMRPKPTPNNPNTTRSQFLQKEIDDISEIISLLKSTDKEKIKLGMQKIKNLLPVLLAGGFSQNEVVAYLTAKKTAAQNVLKKIENEK